MRSASERRCFIGLHHLAEVDALGADVHHLVPARGQVLAHVVGSDRQLPVAAVDHDRELHRPRAPVGVEGVEGGPDRAAGEEDVVDQHHDGAVDVHRDVGDRLGQHRSDADVVAEERDVERADRRRGAVDLVEGLGQRAARPTPPVCIPMSTTPVEAVVALDDLVGHPPDGPPHVVGVHHLAPGNENAPVRGRRASFALRPWAVVLPAVRASRDPLNVRAGP